MKKHHIKTLLLSIIFGLFSIESIAQTQRYPADVTPILGSPYSLFFSDYTDPGRNHLTANIVFNDFNETSWSFKLRVTIESTDIRIQTIDGYTPPTPIVVQPGVLTQFTAADWVDYLNINNLTVSGSGRTAFLNSGRLPEGTYSFCIEVLDYATGDPLSRETCTTAWLQLNDPPRIISPTCGSIVDPALVSFPIQWQLFNTQSINDIGTEYQLTVWEITDPDADPFVAVPNAQTLQVFQSDFSMITSFNYGPAEPLLELGKRYVYQVQARSLDGRDSFKNNGYSEFCYFNYGYPEGGTIPLKWPEDDEGFRSEEIPYLSWDGPNNLLPNQQVAYQVKVMKMEEGQTREEAYQLNSPWYAKEFPEQMASGGGSMTLPSALGKSEKYAWKVEAYTGEQKIAESEVWEFNGPSLVEFFYAGNHRVEVDYINGKDVTNISGAGKVRLTANLYDWHPLEFENLKLIDNGGFWVLDSGQIFIDIPDIKNINLNPTYDDNSNATFGIEQYRLDKVGLFAWGEATWDLPHATVSTEKPVVHTIRQWANYNNFQVNTVIPFPENANRFDLLEPFGFTLDLDETSLFYINNNSYTLETDGTVYAPENVRRKDTERASFVFYDAQDLFYMEAAPDGFANTLQPLANTQYWLKARKYTIDLSEKVSPGRHSGTLDWKGIDIASYDLTFDRSPDHQGQFQFQVPFSQAFEQNGNGRYADLTNNGLSMALAVKYDNLNDTLKFQTFPSNPLSLDIYIENNNVEDKSKLVGDFLIPFVSLTDRYGYEVPITNQGFEKGFLTDLEGVKFTHNPGSGDQEIFVTIQRAALSGNERITMTLDLDWPGMGINLTSLRDFKVWGDYSVGFVTQNGTVALEQRQNALMSKQEFPVTIGVIGAGAYKGQYLFATTADIVLGEDVSGPDQEPTVNVYSSVKNPFVPDNQEGAIGDLPAEGPTLEEATAELEQQMNAYEESILSKLSQDLSGASAAAEAYQNSLAGGSSDVIAEDLINTQATEAATINEEDDKMREIVEAFVTVLATHYTQSLTQITAKANEEVKTFITEKKDQTNDLIGGGIDKIVDPIVNTLANALQNDQIDVSSILRELGEIAKASTKQEIKNSLDRAVQSNILDPVSYLLYDQVNLRVQNYLIQNGTDVFYLTLKGEDGLGALEDMVTGIPGLAGEILGDAAQLLKPDAVQKTVENLVNDFISDIDTDKILNEIKGKGQELILKELENFALDKAADLASDFLEEQGLPAFAGGENPIDFAGIGSKLADGDYAGALQEALPIDPLPLNMVTPIVELSGYVYYTPNDPDYGNVWVGDIDMSVKVPKPFNLSALYINGRIGDNSYWFVEIRGNEEKTDEDPQKKAAKGGYQLGDPIPKEARPLAEPVDMGIADLVGVSGRLYHHMREDENGGIIPDPNLRFGAYMNVVFFDKNTGGQNMRLSVAGEINTEENGDYTLEFDGNLQLQSQAPTVQGIDENAAVKGTILIKYNSAEKHFFGYATVELNKPGTICASGSLLVDVKPGEWRVALGSREERLIFVPGCVGWSPTGWLDVNQSEAELGLGVQWSVEAKTPTFNFLVYKVNFAFEAGFAFGIMAAVQYRPSFALLRAGIWIDLWARVVMNHKSALGSWKQLVLVDISLSGDLILYFVPKPTLLEGTLKGYIKVLFFNANVNASFSKEI